LPELKTLHRGLLDLSATSLKIVLKMANNDVLQYRASGADGTPANNQKANIKLELKDLTIY